MTSPVSAQHFDRYVMVDWSAASKPTTGKDSIWIGARDGTRTEVENIPTRFRARARLHSLAADAIRAQKRLLIGVDFPFGYPAGVARRVTGHADALALWRWIAARLRDGPDNANNRYELAAEINRLYAGTGPFWGRPSTWNFPEVPTTAKAREGRDHPPEHRLADQTAKGAKTVWQLAYAGSVGSQILTGLPALLALRDDPELAPHTRIWPFETGLTTPDAPVVIAEIYPSLIPPDPSETIKDAGQVRAVCDWLAGLDRDALLAPLFAGPPEATPSQRRLIATEEAWILGLEAPRIRPVKDAQASSSITTSLPGAVPPPQPPKRLRYERDPAEIYRQSFATVRDEARLDHLPEDLHDTAIRLVHACGMPDISARLAWSPDVAASAQRALSSGAPIICDAEGVSSMVVRNRLPKTNRVLCTLNAPEVRELAQRLGTTRSAAAVELWREHLAGAVIAIGNAPTALFHLLERLDEGWPRPAAILGFPVGFVGAAESKAELAANPRGTPFLTLRGRRGGSAMAAAAVNALAAGLKVPA
ncbi:MAG: precorrin-8X methylmutase [Pseudomonadota bacterium]